MIIVKGCIPVKEAAQKHAVELVQSLAAESRQETGCLAYEVYLSADDPRVIMVWQQWSSLSALELHFSSDHVDVFLDEIPEMIDGEVTSIRFDVTTDENMVVEESLEMPQLVLADNVTLH